MENVDPHDSQNKDRQMARFFILDLGEGGWGFAVKFHAVQVCSLTRLKHREFCGLFAASGSLLASYTIRV